MKILLIHLPHGLKKNRPLFFPSGVAYIAAILLNSGHKVDVIDIEGEMLKRKTVKNRLRWISSYDLIGISAYTTQLEYLAWLVKQIREVDKSIKICVGGMAATTIPQILLRLYDVDFVVRGEGEETIIELLNILERGGNFAQVNGISYMQGNQIKHNPPSPPPKNLDKLPFPAWDIFPVERYIKSQNPYSPKKYRYMPVVPSRGCPFKCIFCIESNPNFHKDFRIRSVENVLEEIILLKQKYRIEEVDFNTQMLSPDKKWIIRLCDEFIKNKLDIVWTSDLRADTVDEFLLKRMKEAGCVKIFYGFESGSQKILDYLNKSLTVEDIKNCLKLHKKLNLMCYSQFIIGSREETTETVQETIELCKEFDIAIGGRSTIDATVGFLTPFPGTVLYEEVKHLVNEEKYIIKLGKLWKRSMPYSKMLLNMTKKFSDRKLKNYYKEVTKELKRHYTLR